jgi:predicted amidohydrolase YtcJ
MSSAAQELVLDAFEAALGPTGPIQLHHRIEHAVQVTARSWPAWSPWTSPP